MATGPEHDPMPVFVLKGKDALAPGVIDYYRRECERHDLADQAAQVRLAVREMADWQARNWPLVKLPDHAHVPVQRQGGGAAAPAAPAGPTPTEIVWVAAMRRGIPMHRYLGVGRPTVCGLNAQTFGHTFPADNAVELWGSEPCPWCWPADPTGGTR